MKKLILAFALFLLTSLGASAQNYNFNVGGLQHSSGASVPGSCPQEGGLFFKNAATTGWYQCSGGTYVAMAGGGGGTPGGSSGQVQFNNSGSFGGDSGLAYNSTTKSLGVIGTIVSGQAGTQNGELDLNGTTSGTATITAPAVAGTVTNPFALSNAISFPDPGSATAPNIQAAGTPTSGLSIGTNTTGFVLSGVSVFATSSSAANSCGGTNKLCVQIPGTYALGWPAAGLFSGATDGGISRGGAAATMAVGNGVAGDTTGKIKAAGYMSVGTKFTTNNGCTDGTNVGGATAGEFVVGSTSCTEIVTMGNTATAPNGWTCSAYDKTTLADVTNPHQTGSTATTATFVTGTVVSGDHIAFSCLGY